MSHLDMGMGRPPRPRGPRGPGPRFPRRGAPPYYGGGYNYPYPWWWLPVPILEVSPIGPVIEAEDETVTEDLSGDYGWPSSWREKIKREVMRQARRQGGMGQFSVPQTYIDPMGPGAHEGTDVDFGIPAQQALLWRQAAGLVGMGDVQDAQPKPASTARVAATVLGGAVLGLAAGTALAKLIERL